MLQKIQLRPGVNREGTNYSNEGGWFESEKIRFRSGFPEKIGGWTQATPTQTYRGVCRAMWNWTDLNGYNLISVGTNLKYYVNSGLGIYHNITPIRSSVTINNNPFGTTDGEQIVVVTDTAHGAGEGDFVTFSGATGFNGVSADVLNAEYEIITIIDANSYEIELPAGVTPNATGSGGGASVDADYQITIGLAAYVIGNGYGAGVWNGANLGPYNTTLTYTSGTTPWVLVDDSSTTINVTDTSQFPASGTILIDAELITYSGKTSTSFTGCTRGFGDSSPAVHALRPTAGTPAPVYVYSVVGYYGATGWGDATIGGGTGVGQQMRIWTQDNYGQDLVAAYRGGPIYYWTNNTSTWTPAAPLVTDVPIVATNQVIVSDVSRFVIAMGCNQFGSGSFNPMVVRWSDQEDPNTWTPAITNQSGEQLLSNGSYIVQAEKNRQEILIWTDSAIYSMQYLGPPYVWGFQLLMDNISIMGPNAAIVVNNVAYWMGTDKFYSYSGVVQTLPCALRQYVFDDISFDQRFQTVAGSNEGYNEVWWLYVSQTEVNAATSENRIPVNDRYVIYNHLERVWYYGNIRRTFWLDSALQQYPMAAQCNIPTGGTNTDSSHTDIDNGTLVFHENGNDDASTATPVPFTAYVSSSDFDIGDGHNFGYVWRIIPDVNFTGSTNGFPQVYMQVSPRNFPGAPYSKAIETDTQSAQQYFPNVKQYIIQQFTQQVYSRVRGRQMRMTVGSEGQLGVAWQLGTPRVDIKPDGRR
jgi:hypothetical protein